MDKRVYLSNLFDCYQELLTANEKECFLDYYDQDFSIGEIAENNSVSRSAIHKTLKGVIEKLEDYESKLHLYEKKEKIIELLDKNCDKNILGKIRNIL